MRFDRHLFGSRQGYETLAHSKGVTPDEQSQLSELGFGQTSDPAVLASLESRPCVLGRPLRTGRIAITRVFEGAPDDAGRPTLQLRTLVMDEKGFHAVRSQIEALLHDECAWQRDAFENAEPFEWKGRARPLATPTDEAWHLADWAMELQGREDIVLRVPDDPRGEAAILSLVSSVSNTDACALRWGLRLFSTSAAADICSLLPSAALSPRRRVVDVALSGPFKHPHLEAPNLRAKGLAPFERLRSPEQVGPGYALESHTRPTPGRSIPASHPLEPEQPRSRRWVVAASITAILLVGVGLTLVLTWPQRHSTAPAVAQAGPSSNQDTRAELGDSAGAIASETRGEADTEPVEEVPTTDDASTMAAAPSEPKTPTTGRKAPKDPLVDPNGGMNITGPGALGAPSTSSPADGDDPKDSINPREETSRANDDPEDPFPDSRDRLEEEKATITENQRSDQHILTKTASDWNGTIPDDPANLLREFQKKLKVFARRFDQLVREANSVKSSATKLDQYYLLLEKLRTAKHKAETELKAAAEALRPVAESLARLGIDPVSATIHPSWFQPRLESPAISQSAPSFCCALENPGPESDTLDPEVIASAQDRIHSLETIATVLEDCTALISRLSESRLSKPLGEAIEKVESTINEKLDDTHDPDTKAHYLKLAGDFAKAQKGCLELQPLLSFNGGSGAGLQLAEAAESWSRILSQGTPHEILQEGCFLTSKREATNRTHGVLLDIEFLQKRLEELAGIASMAGDATPASDSRSDSAADEEKR